MVEHFSEQLATHKAIDFGNMTKDEYLDKHRKSDYYFVERIHSSYYDKHIKYNGQKKLVFCIKRQRPRIDYSNDIIKYVIDTYDVDTFEPLSYYHVYENDIESLNEKFQYVKMNGEYPVLKVKE